MLSKSINAALTPQVGDVGFTKTYSFRTDYFELPIKLTDGQLKVQSEWPIHLITDSISRKWWLFQDSFYWDNEDLDAIEVKCLILEIEAQERLKAAHERLVAENERLAAENAELLRLAKEIQKRQKKKEKLKELKPSFH